jgi:hypothetical protein
VGWVADKLGIMLSEESTAKVIDIMRITNSDAHEIVSNAISAMHKYLMSQLK